MIKGRFCQNIHWYHVSSLLMTSFCSISLILPLHRLFEHLYLNFKKCLLWIKLLNLIRGTFWHNIYLTPCLFFTYDVICYVILLYFPHILTSSPFRAYELDFDKIFIIVEVVKHVKRNILGKCFLWHPSFFTYNVMFDIILLYFLILHCLFKHLHLILRNHLSFATYDIICGIVLLYFLIAFI